MPDPQDTIEAKNAAAQFRIRAQKAAEMGFAAGVPNFYFAPAPFDGQVGGTILINAPGATWQDVPLTELGSPDLDDFGGRMRATQDFAGRAGYVGGFPTFFHADHGKGVVCGTMLLTADVAEWRDVPLAELGGDLKLADIGQRFRDTQDYANRSGLVGGFPNMYDASVVHADRPGRHTVCGTILLRGPLSQWQDVEVSGPVR
ncbi:MAG TPA: hypothetical protein VFY45_18575 [Baekduia sp.]|nr:hypothetical protein [Baekduia sp.]